MGLDKINRVVLSKDIKEQLDEKATSVELQNTKSYLENQINNVVSNLVRKPSVSTYKDIKKVYPHPEEGWTLSVDDTNITYQYDSQTDTWIKTSINALPKATSELDGLLTKEDKMKLDGIQANAQVNIPPQEMFEEIKKLSNSGKGLDADTLDGKHANEFANIEHNHDGRYYTKKDTDIKYALKTEVNNLNENLKEKVNKSQIPTKISQLQNDEKYVTQNELGKAGYGDMLRNIYDTNNDGVVDRAEKITDGKISYSATDIKKIYNAINDINIKTISKNDNIIDLESNVGGIVNITLEGNTLYKKKDETYTNKYEKGCTLESVGEKEKQVVIKSIGKNLFDITNLTNVYSKGGFDSKLEYMTNGIKIFGKGDFKQYIKVKPNTNYHFKVNVDKSHTSNGCFLWIKTYDEKKTLLDTEYDKTFNTLDNTEIVIHFINWTENKDEYSVFTNVQLEECSKPTEYEDYREDKIIISLKEPLRGFPNGTRDTINLDGIITKRIRKLNLNDISEKFSIQMNEKDGWTQFEDSLIFAYYFFEKDCKVKRFSSLYSNSFSGEIVSQNNEGVAFNCGTGWSYLAIRVKKSKLLTLDEKGLQKYLRENPITVLYELENPITENICEQLSLKTFKNGHILVDTKIAPYLTVKYPMNIYSSMISILNSINTHNLSNTKVSVNTKAPSNPQINDIWIDTNK